MLKCHLCLVDTEMIETLKLIIRKNAVVYGLLKAILSAWRARIKLREWVKAGRPVPPPHVFKQRTVKGYASRYSTHVLIETGTHLGTMVYAVRKQFERIESIELDTELYNYAVQRFSQFDYIHIHHGDSGDILPAILEEVDEPCLFWLDSHYSGSGTARGNLDTPIMQELSAIFEHHVKNHVILIDDARDFVGKNDYPTLDELESFVCARRPNLHFDVNDDIIRLVPFHERAIDSTNLAISLGELAPQRQQCRVTDQHRC